LEDDAPAAGVCAKFEQLQHPVNHGETQRHQRVERASGDTVHQLLQEEGHACVLFIAG
jgi:hypothetical protein